MFRLATYSPAKIEEDVLAFWRESGVFREWARWREGRDVFAFLEGPPTTNGYPHMGHIRGRTYKDIIIRFNRLLGKNVWVQGGWDMQGLPVELEVEKKLGLKTKKDVEKFGLEEFVRECNELVNYYLKYWAYWGTVRLGLWLDLENAYETRSPRYVEHVWAFIRRMWELGLLFEDFRVLWFCPRCETSLSDAEVALGYEARRDPSIYVKFPVEGRTGEYLVIWTTTPWTLIDNEAVAVNPELAYVKIGVDGEYWWVAADALSRVSSKLGLGAPTIVEERRGSELEGLAYVHPFAEEIPERASRRHRVYAASFVSAEEGTGLVHIAPGHGPEDFELAKSRGLPITNSVEVNGTFNHLAGPFAGKSALEIDGEVIEALRRKGLLAHSETVEHEYPHCWRCGTKLLLRSDRQWFVRITAVRGRLVEELKRVNVVPEKLRDRFDVFVENARDWNISRSRIWGTPLPIWRCRDNGEILVVGSLDELKRYAAHLPEVDDFWLVHRPWIDRVKINHGNCSEWTREPYVVDVWMDSGVAWIAAVDGLRNKDMWERLFPYDFVTEGQDQTRGWFYSLLATSVPWTGKAPYRNVLIQGLILDKHGQKMSKSRGNVIWAEDIFKRHGADPTRLYIALKSAPWDALPFNPDEVVEAYRTLNILWNMVKFADTYMDLDGFSADKHRLEELYQWALKEDRWILSRFYTVVKEVRQYLEGYQIHHAARTLVGFIVEDLSHRYIRLLRRRVWMEEERRDKYAAYAVFFHVLKGTLVVASAFVPFITEYLWQAFVRKYDGGAEPSVHLSSFPAPQEGYIDVELESAFDELFRVFSVLAEARNRAGIKLRWPLAAAYVAGVRHGQLVVELLPYLGNVREVKVGDGVPEACNDGGHLTHSEMGITVCIPSRLDEGLLMEAYAREIVRRVQVMRNRLGLRVEERIVVYIDTDDAELAEAVRRHEGYILNETRARRLERGRQGDLVMEWDIEGKRLVIGIARTAD